MIISDWWFEETMFQSWNVDQETGASPLQEGETAPRPNRGDEGNEEDSGCNFQS